MTITVKVGEAKTHLSELLAQVEAGEEVIIARGKEPIAKLSRIRHETDLHSVIAEIKAARQLVPRQRSRRSSLGAMEGVFKGVNVNSG